MKKLGILLVALLLVLSGCGGFGLQKDKKESSGKKTTIEFWTFWGSKERKGRIDKIIRDYNASQDKVVVKHTYVPFSDIWTKNLAAVAAGNPPDVIINDINATALRGKKKQATNLQKYIDKDDISKDYYKNLWDATLYKGDSYGIPFNTDTRMLFYNKDLFKKAGLDPEKGPTTWKELESYAKKLDKKSGNKYEQIGFYPLFGVGSDVWLINGAGQNYINSKGKVEINTKNNRETMQWLKDWQDRYGKKTITQYQSQFDNQQSNPFMNGKVAMVTKEAAFYNDLNQYAPNLHYGVVPLPEKNAETGHKSWGGGFVAEIPKGAAHPDEAWDFIKFLTNEKNQTYWAVENFDNVANIKAAESAAKSSKLNKNGRMVFSMATKNMANTILTPVPLVAPNYFNLVNPQLDHILNNKKSIEAGLSKAQKDVENLVKENK